jgi:prepilin peptidase dependent protein B
MRRRSRGLSIIELLVGTAIGLIVAAAAAAVVSSNVHESRRLQLEARLMQELRSTAGIVARDLRRAGYWAASASGVRGEAASAPALNPHRALSPQGAASDAVRLSFSREAGDDLALDDHEQFGFRLRNGAIEVQLGSANWQTISDAGTLLVTAFDVEPVVDLIDLQPFCERACAAGSTTCPPRQQVRSFALSIEARSTVDPAVVRSLRSSVRVRNDAVVGSCQE